ncbi:MAG: hypothetical protein CFE32_10495 [Alphaproteobacteria bacterium PA3]|nr:MAG: hypothetical protein CFE32_10495 [Alphaproteobacteria bacterium PA3]
MVTQNLVSIIFDQFNRVKRRFASALDPLKLAAMSTGVYVCLRQSRPESEACLDGSKQTITHLFSALRAAGSAPKRV